jgi:hypothetical protein
MTRRRMVGWLLAWLLFWPVTRAWGQDDAGQAALVVVLGDSHVETRCVSLEEGALTGADLLQRTDLDIVFEVSALGQKVCQIEDVGCRYPDEPCFCRCMSSDCTYWNYYYRAPGDAAWIYSPLGSGARQIQPGGMEGWVWGDGRTPPPDLAFEDICAPPVTATATIPPTQAEPSATPQPSPALRATASGEPQTTDEAVPAAATSTQAATPVPTVTPEPPPAGATQTATAWLPYAAFAGLGMALLLWLVVARRRP